MLLLATAVCPALAVGQSQDFSAWLQALAEEAIASGIGETTVRRALADVRPVERVIELDRRQPEFRLDFWEYVNRVVSEQRVAEGRRMLQAHRALLEDVGERYGIPPRFLVAAWGIESNYGRTQGSHRVVDALVTLAYDDRRPRLFRGELLAALRILDQGHIGLDEMKGSWAGAMGQLQFMPTTFLDYARDGDGDGRKDIWNSAADALESAAAFMADAGWRPGLTWGRQVRVPSGLQIDTGLETVKPLAEWQAMGVRRTDGGDLPDTAVDASLLLPAEEDGPALLVYRNYRVFLRWNRSHLFAVSFGHLADRLIGHPPLERVASLE